jgi:methylenetetrahydrofolate reductase (NADPH)
LKISELYARATRSRPVISFEFFPPKTAEAEAKLFEETVPALKRLGPSFCSVTYGAGGSTREATLRIVSKLKREHGLEAMAHLTCVGSTKEQLGAVLDEAAKLGIENILALRGDPPKGSKEFKPVEGGFAHSVELIRFIRSRGTFAVAVAGYPEGHIEAKDKRRDWDYCAEKVEAGGEAVITQLFYDADDFLAFREHLAGRRGVKAPIIPGILPFLSGEQIRRFTGLCGSKLPEAVKATLDRLGSDDEAVRRYGVEVCTDLCRKLLDAGAPGIHVYTLNRVPSTAEIMANLGLAKLPEPAAAAAGV